METRANYLLIGGFTIGFSLLVIVFSIWISKAQLGEVATFDIVFSGPVSGLDKGGDVRFNGIKVGDVQALRIDEDNPQRVIARVRIEQRTPVRTSSTATLEAVGLTGVQLIQLTAGNPKDPLLESQFGAPPPRLYATAGALDNLLKQGREIADSLDQTLKTARRLLTDENIKHLANTINSLDAATAKLSKSGGAIDRIADASHSVATLSDDAHSKLDTLSVHANAALSNVDRAAGAAADAADQVSDTALPSITAAARDVRRLSASLQQLSADVEDGHVSLIPGGSPPAPTVKVRP